jgi:hypothetical protein
MNQITWIPIPRDEEIFWIWVVSARSPLPADPPGSQGNEASKLYQLRDTIKKPRSPRRRNIVLKVWVDAVKMYFWGKDR